MAQGLQDLNFTQSRDRHALFLVVHEDTLQSDRVALFAMNGFVHLSIGIVSSKVAHSHEESCQKDDNAPEGTFTELGHHGIIALLPAAHEDATVGFELLFSGPVDRFALRATHRRSLTILRWLLQPSGRCNSKV